MRSMWQILCAVKDGEVRTQEQAEALLDEESAEFARVFQISETAARVKLLANIADVTTRYYAAQDRAHIAYLFRITLEEDDGTP